MKRFISAGDGKTVWVRFREHINSTRVLTTEVGDHLRNVRHTLNLSSSSIVVREDGTFKRRIRGAIEIHCQAPTLIRDVGYELPAIYRDVLSHDIYQLNHVTKCPTPLEKDSARESKACAYKFSILRVKPALLDII